MLTGFIDQLEACSLSALVSVTTSVHKSAFLGKVPFHRAKSYSRFYKASALTFFARLVLKVSIRMRKFSDRLTKC